MFDLRLALRIDFKLGCYTVRFKVYCKVSGVPVAAEGFGSRGLCKGMASNRSPALCLRVLGLILHLLGLHHKTP